MIKDAGCRALETASTCGALLVVNSSGCSPQPPLCVPQLCRALTESAGCKALEIASTCGALLVVNSSGCSPQPPLCVPQLCRALTESAGCRALEIASTCGALLVVGSSVQVYSAFRLVKAAHAQGTPVALLNAGSTRADALAQLHVHALAGEALARIASHPSMLLPPT